MSKIKLQTADYGKMREKAQLKIQQTAFMLIAITLFFVLVGIFILNIYMSNLKGKANELEEENAMALASKIANSPEFSCEQSLGNNRIDCIDADKVMILKENIKRYSNFCGVSNIEIRKIYPIQEDRLCDRSNYPNCNKIQLYQKDFSGDSISNFVILCRKETYEGKSYNKCELAKISISYDEK
jgi:hypothetical protein